MGWRDSIGPGIAPPDTGGDELEELRRKAAQAGQLTSLGAAPELAGRWAGRRRSPTPQDYIENFEEASAYGPLAERTEKGGPLGPGAYFAGYDESERVPLPIFGNTMEVPADRSELGARAEGIPGLENALGSLGEIEGPTRRVPQASGLAQAPREEDLFEGSDELGELGRIGGNIWNEGRRTLRDYGIWGEKSDEIPEWQGGGAVAKPGAPAPSGIGARPAQPAVDPQVGSPSEFRARIEQDQRDQQARRQQGLEADYARGLSRLEGGPMPGFEYGPSKSLASIEGREISGAGLRSGDGVTSGLDVFDRPDGSSVYRSQANDSIYATSGRRASDAELEGLRNHFVEPQTGMDPREASSLMRLASPGSGGQILGDTGTAEADAFRDDARYRDSQEADSLAKALARAQVQETQAKARDPQGLERYRMQQELEERRFGYQNQGRLQTSLADDQFRAQQKSGRDAEVQKITTDYLDTRRALEEELARIPPNAPPDSLEAAKAAEIQRELDRNERQTELELAQRGVRINSGT